jgi:6-phosphofructokinase 2
VTHSDRIITLTLNPALDLASSAEAVRPVRKIRTTGDHVDPGGGGINAARVLTALGADALAVIATGGVTGRYVESLLDDAQVPWRAVPIRQRTRISVTVVDRATGLEYRFVPQGPSISDAEWSAVLAVLDEAEGSWLIASGSLPPGAPADAYAQVARIATRRGQRFVLDTSGPPLAAALGCGIELIKPSLGELEAHVGHALREPAEQEAEAISLVRGGAARMVAVTLGPGGAILATLDGVVRLPALPVPLQSAVGAGDAFLAATTLSLARGGMPHEALAWGIAAGAVAIAGMGTARVERAEVEARYRQLVPAPW